MFSNLKNREFAQILRNVDLTRVSARPGRSPGTPAPAGPVQLGTVSSSPGPAGAMGAQLGNLVQSQPLVKTYYYGKK